MNITTTFIYPPIPDRHHDWCAYDSDDEEGPTGYGETEAEALKDYIDTAIDKLLSEAYADGRSDQLEEMKEFQKWDEKEKQ